MIAFSQSSWTEYVTGRLRPMTTGLGVATTVSTEGYELGFPPKARSRCTPLHATSGGLKNEIMSRMPGDLHTLTGRPLLEHGNLELDFTNTFCMTNYWSSRRVSGVFAHSIKLKEGAVVTLSLNFKVVCELTNGAKILYTKYLTTFARRKISRMPPPTSFRGQPLHLSGLEFREYNSLFNCTIVSQVAGGKAKL